MKDIEIEILKPDKFAILELPFYECSIEAGFPSPAEDYLDKCLDLNRELIHNPSSTFFGRVRGNSMIDAGIFDGDMLVIDKSLSPKHNSTLVCFLDGEFTVKKVAYIDDQLYLMPQNPKFKPIKVSDESDFRIWGVVVYSIHKH